MYFGKMPSAIKGRLRKKVMLDASFVFYAKKHMITCDFSEGFVCVYLDFVLGMKSIPTGQ